MWWLQTADSRNAFTSIAFLSWMSPACTEISNGNDQQHKSRRDSQDFDSTTSCVNIFGILKIRSENHVNSSNDMCKLVIHNYAIRMASVIGNSVIYGSRNAFFPESTGSVGVKWKSLERNI